MTTSKHKDQDFSEDPISSVNLGRFFIGLIMMSVGGYLFFDNIQVIHNFSLGHTWFSMGNLHITTGTVLIPFIFGIGMIFYNPDNDFGWILAILSLAMLLFGVIFSVSFKLKPMSSFELLMILTLFIGGMGVFLSSVRWRRKSKK